MSTEITALLDYLVTGKRNGQPATAGSQFIGVSHRLVQVVGDQLAAGNALLKEGNDTLRGILAALTVDGQNKAD